MMRLDRLLAAACLVAALLTLAPGVGIAWAIDSEAAKPYDLQVVVRFVPHRLLTPAFRRQFETELLDALQSTLGIAGRVEVVEADDRTNAWPALGTLDARTDLQPAKRHYLQLEFADGQYVVTARQRDGSTGLASPRVRQARTSDRAFAARLAMKLIDLDFGAVGAVIGKDGETVRLQLRGSAIGGPDAARLAPVGSVFALSRIEGEPPRGRAVPSTYLRVVRSHPDGICDCQIVSRFLNPLGDWPQVSYRAIRLGTVSAPVRLQLVDPNGLPQQNLLVLMSATGFRPDDAISDQGPARDGAFASAKPYSGLAYVRVVTGDQQRMIPVPVLDDQPVVCVLDAASGGASRQQFDFDVRNVHHRLQDIVRRLTGQKTQLDAMLRDSRNKDALERVQSSLEVLDNDLAALTTEVGRLRRSANELKAEPAPLLENCDTLIREIRGRRESLGKFESELKKVNDTESSAENQKKRDRFLELSHRAESQREEADFDGAIATYQQILTEFGARPDIQRRHDDLKAAWQVKNEAHSQARQYAYGPWAKIERIDDVRDRLPEARRQFEVIRAAGDRLTALKFSLVASGTATDIVVRAYEELQQSQTDSDKINLKTIAQIRNDLQAFLGELSKFIRGSEAPKASP